MSQKYVLMGKRILVLVLYLYGSVVLRPPARDGGGERMRRRIQVLTCGNR